MRDRLLPEHMRIVFVMDPIDTVIVDEDTSFAIMIEAQRAGHQVDHALVRDVFLDEGRVCAMVRPATMQRDPDAPVILAKPEVIDLATVDCVFIRKDPPFDADYLWLTLMLERARDTTLVLNDPRGLRDANEKLYACHFPECMPKTIVDSSAARIKAFVDTVGGRAIIKPIDGHGGAGIFALRTDDGNFNSILETVTKNGRRAAMVQEFIPEVREGDKRILLLDGEPLGAILRVPKGDDVRSNIHVGGSVVKAELTEADRKIVAAVAPRLREDGLMFVGLDVIGGRLTEVNVTSPTGIQQMSRLDGQNYEARVVRFIEARVSAN